MATICSRLSTRVSQAEGSPRPCLTIGSHYGGITTSNRILIHSTKDGGHPIQQRPRGQLHPGSGFYTPAQSIASSDAVTGHGSRGTGPVPLQQQSHPQMQRLQQAQISAPMTYDMSTVNNISESNRTISVQSTVAGSYGLSSHASSSIPMSNNPPPPLPSPRHSHHNILHHEIGNTRHQHQGQPQTRHQTRNTSGAPSRMCFLKSEHSPCQKSIF